MASAAILLVEDHELVRMGLRAMLDSMKLDGTEILEASSLKEAIQVYENASHEIRLVILDLNLPDSKGLSALQAFKLRFPKSRVMVLSGAVDPSICQEARELGAEHFLHKASAPSLIEEVLRKLPLGSSQSWSGSIMPGVGDRAPSHVAKRMRLSDREVEILDLVLQGHSNQEIVDRTALRLGTVKNYISGLLVVFGVSSRSRLISLFR